MVAWTIPQSRIRSKLRNARSLFCLLVALIPVALCELAFAQAQQTGASPTSSMPSRATSRLTTGHGPVTSTRCSNGG